MLLSSFKEISPRGPPQQMLKEQKPSFSIDQAPRGWNIKRSCQELSKKPNLLPPASDQNKQKILSDGFQIWEDLQLQLKKD